MDGARDIVEDAIYECLSCKNADWGKIKNAVREALGAYVWKNMQRRPMILPIILEV